MIRTFTMAMVLLTGGAALPVSAHEGRAHEDPAHERGEERRYWAAFRKQERGLKRCVTVCDRRGGRRPSFDLEDCQASCQVKFDAVAGPLRESRSPASTSIFEPQFFDTCVLYNKPTIQAMNGMCLDVRGASTANRTYVQMYECNCTAAQDWYLEPGSIRGLAWKALDMPYNVNGGYVWMFDYYGGWRQQWGFNNFTLARGDLCVAPGFRWGDANFPQQFPCGSAHRITHTGAGELKVGNGTCLENLSGNIITRACSGSAAQKWRVDNGNVVSLADGQCLSPVNDRSGSVFMVRSCASAGAFRLKGEIRNSATGKCLEWPWWSQNWTNALISTCNGTYNQQWAY